MKTIIRIARSILMIGVGVVALVCSSKCYDMSIGDYELRHSYGGDAYTGIQNACAHASKNTKITNEFLRQGFGSILLIAGLGFIAYGITPIQIEIEVKKEKSNDKPESTPASTSNPTV